MKFNLPILARRIHLYFGLICLPWFIMYGITSVAFNHADWFGKSDIEWTVEQTWPCTLEVDLDKPFPKELGVEMLTIAGMAPDEGGVYRWGKDPIVYVGLASFWRMQRLTYPVGGQEMVLETRAKTMGQFLTSLHATGGYNSSNWLRDFWAVMVDIVCISFLIWIVSGLYLWWRFSRMRLWGGVALLSGLLSFVFFMLFL